jgi:hypothetical protein
MTALRQPASGCPIKSQRRFPTAEGLTSFSTRLESISNLPSQQITDQGRILVKQIADGFAQGALGEHARVGPDRLGPPLHGQPEGGGLLEPALPSLFGAGVLEFSSQLIELAHLADEPQGFRAFLPLFL